jgi:adenylate cyclase, class 2
MKNYIENEVKILDVDINKVSAKLERLGAKKVFEGARSFITFDNREVSLLERDIELRITEEGTTKFSLDEKLPSGEKRSIKLKISRAQEMQDILARLDIVPVSKVKSHRISYELGKIDFDIDQFPRIPPFLEIDLEHYVGELSELLEKLGLSDKEVFRGSTIELYSKYGHSYTELFKL